MARTKRKVNPLSPPETPVPAQEKVFQAGAYIRLSLEDNGKPGSDTIETQRCLLHAYISEQTDMRLIDVYCDNGRTGTNFDRPGFERLMGDVRTGRINCIVVKDLSRFGRNYHETSNYLLRIFPFLGVRFVAVNDHFDTQTAAQTEYGLVMPLKNIINDTYSRDISRKVASAIETKERRGEFVGAFAPYGYRKSDRDRNRLEINPETAPVIRDIFSLRLQGLGYAAIARQLNDRGIPSPGAYLFQRGFSKNEAHRNALWSIWTVKKILCNEVYLGHLIQGKRTQASYKQARAERYAPAEEWRVFRNAHEAIIDEGTFSAVQAISEEHRQTYEASLGKDDDQKTPNLFRRLVYCADCGRPLVRGRAYSQRRGGRVYYYRYSCPTTWKKAGTCTPKNLREGHLFAIVLETLQSHLKAVAELECRIAEIWEGRTADQRAELSRKITEVEQKLSRNQALLDGLYQRLVDGIITREEYLSLKRHYQDERRELAERETAWKARQQELLRCGPANPMFDVCRPLYGVEDLSEDLIHTLVSRIDVYDHSRLEIKLVYQDEFLALTRFTEGAEIRT